MSEPYIDIDLIRLSSQADAVHVDREIILLDNFNDSEDDEEPFVHYPVKLSFILAIFCLEGEMSFQINLQRFDMSKDDILIPPEGAIGEFLGISRNAKLAVIAFTPDYFTGAGHIRKMIELQKILYKRPLVRLSEKEMCECLAIYTAMKVKASEFENPFRRDIVHAYSDILTYMAYSSIIDRKSNNYPESFESRAQELYMRFMDEVQRNYMKEREIAFYADRLCVTPKYLSQMIHRASGRFAGEWIREFVILEAKALLKSIDILSARLQTGSISLHSPFLENISRKRQVSHPENLIVIDSLAYKN